jgi:GntR family transcriptional regulator
MGAPYLFLVRLRLGDNEPIGLQSALIITERCPGLEKYDFSQLSLYRILANDYKLRIAQISHTVSAVVADEFQAGLLRVAQSAPLLLVNTTAFLANQEVIEHTTSYYRADKYEFSTIHTYPQRS